jgi:hypothetical protein
MSVDKKDPYNLSHYDSVYILLKEAAEKHEGYKGFVKFDKSRKKHFLSWRIIHEDKPNHYSFSLVPEKDIEAFKKTRKMIDKKKYIISVLFGHIDFITLPFDNFDWVNNYLITPEESK